MQIALLPNEYCTITFITTTKTTLKVKFSFTLKVTAGTAQFISVHFSLSPLLSDIENKVEQ